MDGVSGQEEMGKAKSQGASAWEHFLGEGTYWRVLRRVWLEILLAGAEFLLSSSPNQEENPDFAQPSNAESQHGVLTTPQNPT